MIKNNKEGISSVVYNEKKTNTSLFLLPALEITNEVLQSLGFVNAYLNDDEHCYTYKECVYLLFKDPNIDTLDEFTAILESKNILIDEYDVDKNHVMVVVKFPEEYIKEYKFFKQGKYSKFSKTFIKKYFPFTKKVKDSNGKNKDEHTLYYHIFNKTDWIKNWWNERLGYTEGKELKMDEWWDIPDNTKEVFRYKKNKYE